MYTPIKPVAGLGFPRFFWVVEEDEDDEAEEEKDKEEKDEEEDEDEDTCWCCWPVLFG
jgi:hypothetical protein